MFSLDVTRPAGIIYLLQWYQIFWTSSSIISINHVHPTSQSHGKSRLIRTEFSEGLDVNFFPKIRSALFGAPFPGGRRGRPF